LRRVPGQDKAIEAALDATRLETGQQRAAASETAWHGLHRLPVAGRRGESDAPIDVHHWRIGARTAMLPAWTSHRPRRTSARTKNTNA
jgi:hypothetical protein